MYDDWLLALVLAYIVLYYYVANIYICMFVTYKFCLVRFLLGCLHHVACLSHIRVSCGGSEEISFFDPSFFCKSSLSNNKFDVLSNSS